MTCSAFINLLKADADFIKNVRLWKVTQAREAVYSAIPTDLAPALEQALRTRGINQLYCHQRQAWDHAQLSQDFVVVTPTASGKTLCYNLPVIQAILDDPAARAMYLFPTKALSQDQQSELNEITLAADLGVKIATYDGDTPNSLRASARETGQIIISNPDMLHSGILPNHPKWIKFFRNLRFLVIDELHSYRGVFGSHVANVIARLLRIAQFYGSNPLIIAASATIGNPGQLAMQLCGRKFEVIDKNGSPAGRKHLVLYNPPIVDAVQGIRRGTVNESQAIAVKALRARIKTIVFAKSRIRVELIASYIRDKLANHFTENNGIRVESYRGGYLPNERRAIEKGLRDGSIHAVVSTNALELGIDIGGLDLAILAGYPGGMSSVWQQAGRAGRRSGESMAILIASSAPLDQYMVEHGDYLSDSKGEQAFINPSNAHVRLEHIKCAAFELPFDELDQFFPDAEAYLNLLCEEGVLRKTQERWYWANQSYPAENISLRSASAENVVIIDTTHGKGEVIGEMDRPSAKEMLFPQAVYLHRGRQFLVQDLDIEQHRCYVEERQLNYYTDAVVKTDLKVLHEDRWHEQAGVRMCLGDILVRSQVSRFKKLKFKSHENIGYGEVSLPEEEMHTSFVALCMGEQTAAGQALLTIENEQRAPALLRTLTLLRQVAPAFLLCQYSDFGIAERLRDSHFGQTALYVFDAVPGGSGMAEAFASQIAVLLLAANAHLSSCPCSEGCPSCIGAHDSQTELGGNPKLAVKKFLQTWISNAGLEQHESESL